VTLLCGGAEPHKVYLRAEPDNEELLIPMQPAGVTNGLARFEAALPWDRANDATHYGFKVLHGRGQTWLAADGTHPHLPPREVLFKVCREHVPPAWVTEQIAYQIFPDRFCQGDAALAVATDEYVYGAGRSRVVRQPWGAPIDRQVAATAFYGGDLAGIRHQLAYLHAELGVTMLYLNPIFTSGSNHKYDTEDYDHVDPHLGGNAALAELAGALRARGMRLVLDAVVNHTGTNHPWFNRHGRHDTVGAYQSEASPWRSWYLFTGPEDYVSWTCAPPPTATPTRSCGAGCARPTRSTAGASMSSTCWVRARGRGTMPTTCASFAARCARRTRRPTCSASTSARPPAGSRAIRRTAR
jgi:alpha-glucosidase